MGYWYRDKNYNLQYKTDNQIKIEGAVFVSIGMLVALLIVAIFKLAIDL